MFEGQLNMLSYIIIDYWLNGVTPVRMGTRNRMGQPNQAFPTKDGWICIVAANEASWVRCCEALGVPGLATDERFRTLADRAANIEELSDAVGSATSAFTTEECMRRLQEARVVCAPVNTIPQLTTHPQFDAVRAAGGIVEMPVGELGPVPLFMTPIHLSDTPVAALRPPPTLGEHTTDVLSDLGFSAEEIATMRDEGVVG
jgi:crotonobetainyl-CoA:carnitine CoA-transferase CaiB-like acyl-CoA transferase